MNRLNLEKIIYILIIIFFFFLFRRGGDTKYRITLLIIPLCFYYSWKIKKFIALETYKNIYISAFLYIGMLTLIFIFSKNKNGGRVEDLLGMTLYSIILFLALINISVSEKIYKMIFPLITFFSIESIIRGFLDLWKHKEQLEWYRLAGGSYTTIYAGEMGLFFIMGFLCILIYKNKYIKIAYIVYSFLILIIIYFTKSRNAMLMIPITIGSIFFIKNIKRGSIALILVFTLIGFIIKNPCNIEGFNRLSSISSLEKIKTDARVKIFKEGIIQGKNHLLLGEGFYKHKDEYLKLNDWEVNPHYHNIFIETFATQGVITLILYILFLFLLFKEMVKNYYKEKSNIKELKILPIGIFIFLILYGLAEPIFYFSKMYMILFTIISLSFIKIETKVSWI